MTLAQGDSDRSRRRLLVWLGVAVVVAFGPSLLGDFVFDDTVLIRDNPYAHSLQHLGRCFRTDLWDVPTRLSAEKWVLFYRPVATASYILNWKLGGGAAWTFHLVNVLAHLGAVLLAFRTARRWTGDDRKAFVAALVFALHPTRNESVLWISGRTDLLMALFLLLALEVLVVASQRAAGRAWPLWIGGLVAWVAALLSKEYALMLPVLLGVEVLLVPADGARRIRRLRLAGMLAASAVCAGAYLALRAAYLPLRPDGAEPIGLGMHAHYVLLTVGRYVMRTVFPWPQVFTFRPIHAEAGQVVFPPLDTLLGAIAIAAFVAAVLWLARRKRIDAALLVAAGIAFLPIANVSYTGFNWTTADRFFYFPLLPLAIAAIRPIPATWAPRHWTLQRAAIPVGLVLVCLSIGWIRTLDFTSDRAFWEQEVAINPDNPIALATLSDAYAREGDHDRSYASLRRAYAPEGRKYILVADPARYYVVLLSMQATRLPDGAVRDLDALATQMSALARGELRRTNEVVGDLPLDAPVFDDNVAVWIRGQRPVLASNAALVASRLGRDELVREMASVVSDDDMLSWSGRHNLAVALTRAGEHDAARHQLEVVRASSMMAPPEDALRALGRDIEGHEALVREAAAAPEPRASLLRAQAAFAMAAWLRAARTLRPALAAHPDSEPVWSSYLQALQYCRLDDDAYDVARTRLDDVRARAVLAEFMSRASAKTVRAEAIGRGTRWW